MTSFPSTSVFSQGIWNGLNALTCCCAGEANAEHFFVATQDRDLRAALGGVPGGASIFLNVNGVHLEPPSEAQKRSVEHVCLIASIIA